MPQFAKLILHVLMHSMQHTLHAKLQVLNVQLMEHLDVFLWPLVQLIHKLDVTLMLLVQLLLMAKSLQLVFVLGIILHQPAEIKIVQI